MPASIVMADDDSDVDWQHSDWFADADIVDDVGPEFADLDLIRHRIVKLSFQEGKEDRHGCGFFLDIPDLGDQHVILTAAHNLINPTSTRMTNVTVIYSNPGLSSGLSTCIVPPTDIYIGKNYKAKESPGEDYGAIRIPRSSSDGRRGFGFSMKLAFTSHFSGKVYVSGYQDKTTNGFPITSKGGCVACYPSWMEYDAPTQEGLSGSAVWIEYRRVPVVIAIHNNRAKDGGTGNRGARLTPAFFRELYSWLGSKLLQTGVQLRATDTRPAADPLPSGGLFLSFKQDIGFGRVRLNSGTKFDLMAAQVLLDKDTYAMATTEGQWAMFDPIQNEVVLTESVKEACLFQQSRGKKGWVKLVVQLGKDSFQLRMEGRYIESDEDMESSEVSFVAWPAGDKYFFTRFSFE